MTADPFAYPPVYLTAAKPEDGCAACHRQETVQLHPYRGRLCPSHAALPTIPPGPYRWDLAVEFVDLGRPDAAFAYLRAFMAAEIDRRFAAVRAS